MGQSSYLFELTFVGVLGVAVATSENVVEVPTPDAVADLPVVAQPVAQEGVQLTATHRPKMAEGAAAFPQPESLAFPIARSVPRRLPSSEATVVDLPAKVTGGKSVVASPVYPTVIDENGIEWRIIDSRPCDPALCRGLAE